MYNKYNNIKKLDKIDFNFNDDLLNEITINHDCLINSPECFNNDCCLCYGLLCINATYIIEVDDDMNRYCLNCFLKEIKKISNDKKSFKTYHSII